MKLTFSSRLGAERGSAMVVAMGAMSVILLMSAWAAGSSTQFSQSSENDRRSKRALPASEAGLRHATYKLNNLAPEGNACPSSFTASGELCTKGEDAGNGTRYDYWLTKAITSGTCAGFPVVADPNYQVRCVTVQASVNGQSTRRAQARLVRSPGALLFPFPGIFGDQLVWLKNNSTIRGALGSNVRVQTDNNTCVRDGIELGTPGGTVGPVPPSSGPGCDATIDRHTAAEGPFVLNTFEFGQSHLTNDNNRLPVGGSTGATLNSYREMSILGGSYTFPQGGGTFNLCSLYIEGATITIPANSPVTLLIDSPSRNTGCRSNTGTLIANNNVVFQNLGDATNLQIYVAGAGPVEFKNNLTMKGFLHAPLATVYFKNNAVIEGGVIGRTVEAHNNLEFYTSGSGQLPRGTATPTFYRTAWRECTPSRTSPTDYTSGC